MWVCQKQGISSSKESSATCAARSRKNRQAACGANRENCAGKISGRVPDMGRQAFYTGRARKPKGGAEKPGRQKTKPAQETRKISEWSRGFHPSASAGRA